MNKNIWLSLVLIVVTCLSTILMLHSNPHRKSLPMVLAHEPDSFMQDVSYYEYDSHGALHSHLSTPKIIHYSNKNAAQFEKPNVMVYTDKHIPWYISAEHGKSKQGVDWVYLWENVVIHQPEAPNNPQTTIKTSAITFYPMKSYAETYRDVTITRPGSIVQAKGMTADFKKGIITLLSHSRGVYGKPTN